MSQHSVLAVGRGWTAESPESNQELAGAYYKPVLEDPALDLRWYAEHFAGAEEHANFVGKVDAEKGKGGPFCVSVAREMDGFTPRVRGIVWTVHRKSHVLVEVKKHKDWRKSLAVVLKAAGAHDLAKAGKKMVAANSPTVRAELLKLEEFMTPTTYKIGVLHVRKDQVAEEQFFANDVEESDTAFAAFLDVLGDRIELAGWDGYRAGLDVENGGTGEHSIFTSLRGCDIMFHVAAFLPHDTTGQEVQRKRQIGNDVTAIVFCDPGAHFNPASIDSQFLHTYAVVSPGPEPGTYALAFCRQDSVRPFGPLITSPVFPASPAFADFLLTKLINAERSCLKSAPIFVHTTQRTVRTTLNTLFEGLKDTKSPPALAGAASSSAAAALRTIGAGDNGPRDAVAPRQTTDSIFVMSPVSAQFEGELLCVARWGDRFMFSTNHGVFASEPNSGLSGRRISKSPMSRLVVLPNLGIVAGATLKKGTVRTWPLGVIGSGGDVPETKVPNTKGAHFWEVARPLSSTYMAVAKNKSVMLFKWSGTAFAHQHTYALPAKVTVLRFLGTSLILAFEKEFDALELETSEVRELFVPDRSVQPLDVLFLGYSAGDVVSPLLEMVLCYDNKGVVINLFGEVSREFELRWTATPSAFAYLDPYVVAVTPKYIEVRTTLNGTLIQRIALPAPIKLLAFDSSLFVLSSVDGSAPAVWEIKPEVADRVRELDAISESLKAPTSPPGGTHARGGFKLSLAGARLAGVKAFAEAARSAHDDGASHAAPAPPPQVTGYADIESDSDSESGPDSGSGSGSGSSSIGAASGGGVAAAAMESDSESESHPVLDATEVVALDRSGSNLREPLTGMLGVGGAPEAVVDAAHTLRDAVAQLALGDEADVIRNGADAVLRAVEDEPWGAEALPHIFTPLVHMLGVSVALEASIELREQALASATVCQLYDPLTAAVEAVLAALPAVEATVAGVRAALMAVRRLKQFVDTLLTFGREVQRVDATKLDAIESLGDGIADVAGNLVVSTKGFSQGGDGGDDAVRTACELLAVHSRHLFNASVVTSVVHDAEHVAAYAGGGGEVGSAVLAFVKVVEHVVCE